ncbi:MAG: YicC/YloC family endoribonuclease [Pseudohongiellaceae bacterium]
MISSMTAFTRQQSQHEWGLLVWEIRSVNHRYLEASIKLPDSFRNLEAGLRELLRNTLHRGKVEAQLKFTPGFSSNDSLQINQPLVKQLVNACQAVEALIADSTPVNSLDLLKWPGVIQEQQQDTKFIEQQTLKLFEESLDNLIANREREGAELRDMILLRLGGIRDIIRQIRDAMPEILSRQKDRIRAQFAELKLEADPLRLEQEIVLIAQKADINEEVDRLDTHVREVDRILAQDGPVGRRLDFLMQELNREANTICAKAIVTETSQRAVELKVLIEQMREQIQNIE